MNPGFRLLPDSASTVSGSVDSLFFFWVSVTAFFILLITALNVVFAIRYRRRGPDQQAHPVHGSVKLEIFWSVIPLAIGLFGFAWGADIYFDIYTVPARGLDVYVTGKQWMWKFQHPEGKSEIDDLHVPVGVPIRLTMTSEDVIHSLFLPAFRVKRDVLPGRYTTFWFEATKPGRYHLFCAEYCGTEHSGMIGWVYVLPQDEYDSWISGGMSGMSMVEAGQQLFEGMGCVTCHNKTSGARGPDMTGRFGSVQTLADGRSVLFDEGYARESILNPAAKVVAGFKPVMPTFQGQISEENLLRVIAYLKSLQVESGEKATQ